MSASLVGSEMCIRDRSMPCPRASARARARAASRTPRLCRRTVAARGTARAARASRGALAMP
eukprot:11552886-Alexandrium_andersonii.AAC.1